MARRRRIPWRPWEFRGESFQGLGIGPLVDLILCSWIDWGVSQKNCFGAGAA